ALVRLAVSLLRLLRAPWAARRLYLVSRRAPSQGWPALALRSRGQPRPGCPAEMRSPLRSIRARGSETPSPRLDSTWNDAEPSKDIIGLWPQPDVGATHRPNGFQFHEPLEKGDAESPGEMIEARASQHERVRRGRLVCRETDEGAEGAEQRGDRFGGEPVNGLTADSLDLDQPGTAKSPQMVRQLRHARPQAHGQFTHGRGTALGEPIEDSKANRISKMAKEDQSCVVSSS